MSKLGKACVGNEMVCPNAQKEKKKDLQRAGTTLLWLEVSSHIIRSPPGHTLPLKTEV